MISNPYQINDIPSISIHSTHIFAKKAVARPRPLEPLADLRSPEALQREQLAAASLVQRGAGSAGAPTAGVQG